MPDGKPRVVLDTNVVISGMIFGGLPGLVLDLVLDGVIRMAISPALEQELSRVLMSKFPKSIERVHAILVILKEVTILVVPGERIASVLRDPDDPEVLACALSAHAEAIITGDKDLLELKTFRTIPILTPQAFLAKWRAKLH